MAILASAIHTAPVALSGKLSRLSASWSRASKQFYNPSQRPLRLQLQSSLPPNLNKPTLMPAPTRKSTRTDFILVWPLLKSSPPMSEFFSTAYSITPAPHFAASELIYGKHSRRNSRTKTSQIVTVPKQYSIRNSKTEQRFLGL